MTSYLMYARLSIMKIISLSFLIFMFVYHTLINFVFLYFFVVGSVFPCPCKPYVCNTHILDLWDRERWVKWRKTTSGSRYFDTQNRWSNKMSVVDYYVDDWWGYLYFCFVCYIELEFVAKTNLFTFSAANSNVNENRITSPNMYIFVIVSFDVTYKYLG